MVTTTVQEILLAAYSKSTKNKPGTIATESTELRQLVVRCLRSLYALAPRVNYTYFAGFADVQASPESGGPTNQGWDRPQEAESVFRIERTTTTQGGVGSAGDEVVVVPYDDRTAEEGMGAIYRIGQTYFPAGNAPDPTGGELRVFFSRRPDDPATLLDPLDSQWTEQFNEILVLEVAAYLAAKDGRGDEAALLRQEKAQWMLQFVAFLEHAEANERRRFGHIRRLNTNTLVPLTSFGLPAGPTAG